MNRIRNHISTSALLGAMLLLSGCAHQTLPGAVQPGAPGFLLGLGHGFIFPVAWFLSLVLPEVAVYAVPNNGGWYDFGYFLGIVVFGVGATHKTVVVREKVVVPRGTVIDHDDRGLIRRTAWRRWWARAGLPCSSAPRSRAACSGSARAASDLCAAHRGRDDLRRRAVPRRLRDCLCSGERGMSSAPAAWTRPCASRSRPAPHPPAGRPDGWLVWRRSAIRSPSLSRQRRFESAEIFYPLMLVFFGLRELVEPRRPPHGDTLEPVEARPDTWRSRFRAAGAWFGIAAVLSAWGYFLDSNPRWMWHILLASGVIVGVALLVSAGKEPGGGYWSRAWGAAAIFFPILIALITYLAERPVPMPLLEARKQYKPFEYPVGVRILEAPAADPLDAGGSAARRGLPRLGAEARPITSATCSPRSSASSPRPTSRCRIATTTNTAACSSRPRSR